MGPNSLLDGLSYQDKSSKGYTLLWESEFLDRVNPHMGVCNKVVRESGVLMCFTVSSCAN